MLRSALQLTCKFPYLFFPRDIDYAFGIVVKAFVQEADKPRFESCPVGDIRGNSEGL